MTKQHFFLLLSGLLLMASCGPSQAEKQAKADKERLVADSAALKIGVLPTIDALPLFVADAEGLFQKRGVDVVLRPFTAQMDADTALINGVVEGIMTDLVRAAVLEKEGIPLRYATATEAAWQLVSMRQARIRQLRQMDDKMMAITRYSATSLLSDMLVDSVKLRPERVYRIHVNDVGVRLRMLQVGTMDAMLLPEPQATVARRLKAPLLYNSADHDLRLGVLAFSEKALKGKGRETQMECMLKAYNDAVDAINTRGMAALAPLISKRCGVTLSPKDTLLVPEPWPHASDPRPKDIDRVKSYELRVKSYASQSHH